MTPGDLYRTCKVSAYRLETLQQYTVPDDEERQRAFHTGLPLPAPRRDKQDTIDLLAHLRATGRQVGRVHIITWPLSDYVRYEFAVYGENVAAGEDVRIADATEHPELLALQTDFAIFDAETDAPSLILFDYTPEGLLISHNPEHDPEEIADRWQEYQLALRHSVPLGDFLAAHDLSLAG